MEKKQFIQWATFCLFLVTPIVIGCSQDDENEDEYLGLEYTTLAKNTSTRSVEGAGGGEPTVTTKVSPGSTELTLPGNPFTINIILEWEGGNLTRGPQPKITCKVNKTDYDPEKYLIKSQDITTNWTGLHAIQVIGHTRYYKLERIYGKLCHSDTIHSCAHIGQYTVQAINENDYDWEN